MKSFFYAACGFVAITSWSVSGIGVAQDSPAKAEKKAQTLSSLKLELDVQRAELLKPQRELEASYGEQLNRLMDQVTEAGDLEKALTVKAELTGFRKGEAKPAGDGFLELQRLQEIYAKASTERADTLHKKLGPIFEGYRAQLITLQRQLTRDKNLEEAVKARAMVSEANEMLETLAISGPSENRRLDSANSRNAYENSLGMKFVPVPIMDGPGGFRKLLFSVWEVRIRDYEAFVRGTRQSWPKSGFKETKNHPAVLINWEEAKAFCEWLTEKERDAGKIGLKDRYRLPTDHEWSCAVGIGAEEDSGLPPKAKNQKIPNVYPWGGKWSAAEISGNYCGEETRADPVPGRAPIEGYNDGFVKTAPVGSFPANRFGLYDLNGNVMEWCDDLLDPANPAGSRIVRGGCWSWQSPERLLSSFRTGDSSKTRSKGIGIRCVLETAAAD